NSRTRKPCSLRVLESHRLTAGGASRGLGRVHVRGEGLLRDLDERGERRRDVHGQLGQDLAVDLDVRGLQALDEAVVRDAVGAGPAWRRAALGACAAEGRAVCATSTGAANAVASVTASSARILRSPSMFAAFRPWMKRLYGMPLARAAALMRWIHSWRKSPLRFLRSL